MSRHVGGRSRRPGREYLSSTGCAGFKETNSPHKVAKGLGTLMWYRAITNRTLLRHDHDHKGAIDAAGARRRGFIVLPYDLIMRVMLISL